MQRGRIRYCELTMKIQKQDDVVIALQMTKLRHLLWPKSKSMLGFIQKNKKKKKKDQKVSSEDITNSHTLRS